MDKENKKNVKIGITGKFRSNDLFFLDSELDFFDKCICFQYLEGHVPELMSNNSYSFPRIINAIQYKSAIKKAIFGLIKSYIAAVLFVGLMIFSVLLLKYNLNFPPSGIEPFFKYTGVVALLLLLCFAGYLPVYLSIFNRFCRCGLSFYMKSPELCEKYLAWERSIIKPSRYSAEDFIPQPAYRLRGIKLPMEPNDLYTILEYHLDREYTINNCTRRTRGLRGMNRNYSPYYGVSNNKASQTYPKNWFLWILLLILVTTPVFLIKFTLDSAETNTITAIFTGILCTINLVCISCIIYQIRENLVAKRLRHILEHFKNRKLQDNDLAYAFNLKNNAPSPLGKVLNRPKYNNLIITNKHSKQKKNSIKPIAQVIN